MSNVRPSTYTARICLKRDHKSLYRWHCQVANYVRSYPSYEGAEIVQEEVLPGGQVRLYLLLNRAFRKREYIFRLLFPREEESIKVKTDKSDFRYFEHQSRLIDLGDSGTELIEKVEFTLSAPWFFRGFREKKYRKRLDRFFRHKHDVMLKDLEMMDRYPFEKSLKILISGSSGLIGSSLLLFLRAVGHDVWILVRSAEEADEKAIYYNTRSGEVDRSRLEGFDVVVHLWGHSIQKRWTKKTRQKVMESRYQLTKSLAKIFAGLQSPPKAFLSASAIGYYGDRGAELMNESNQKGKGSFLADVCTAWENACSLMKTRGIRVVHLRFGMVLSLSKGALQKMITPFKLGLGGVFGTGQQYMSWVAIDDVTSAIYHTIMREDLVGPVNIVSPGPVTNREFTETLAKHLGRAVGPRVPKFALKLVKGQMADELLFSSTKVEPKRLIESGYRFRYPSLKSAFNHLINT